MGEAHPDINGLKPEAAAVETSSEEINTKPLTTRYKWWLKMLLYSFFVLAGQSVATILGRVYYDNDGKSNWMATLVQVISFPFLTPFQFCTKNNNDNDTNLINTRRQKLTLAAFYVAIGIFLAVDCMLYSIGLQYLPVTTYTLICASQLGFNAVFSLFLNRLARTES